jgi:hypothetical protein
MNNIKFVVLRIQELDANVRILEAEALVLKAQLAALVQSSGDEGEKTPDTMSQESYDRVLKDAMARLQDVEKKI